ncbi:ABC transporter ATP-binding protein [Companilactobacillus sp. RD055328]|uniref:metal ABC transporter ATP-binding protein n=1 Tax=Companilactobacillus sp. RD055328 TaxID=2916634 RepID=UPI001FC8000A|nr:ATP-binding cassette domain-containing protein [Companilactobacillus sp. RD055328]GKQ43473.1 ABC transporter ATP-binding protein [Companilactobacillus sp. RD055328]
MIEFINLSKAFPDKTLFKNVNFTLEDGDFLSIIGKNGTGKTTLVKILMGLEKPTSGHIKFNKSKLKFGYVPQFRNIETDYPLSIQSFVELNLKKTGFIFKNKKDRLRLRDALQKTGLWDLRGLRLGLASGGEKQKAYLAQAIVNNPDVLILDESTASLDGSAKEKLMELVKSLNEEQGLTIIFVTHDYLLAKKFAHKYLLFDQKQIEMKEDIASLDERVFED